MSFDDERRDLRRQALLGDEAALDRLEFLARRFPRGADEDRRIEARSLARMVVTLREERLPDPLALLGPRPVDSRRFPWVLRVAGHYVDEFPGRWGNHADPGEDARRMHVFLVRAVEELLWRADSVELLDRIMTTVRRGQDDRVRIAVTRVPLPPLPGEDERGPRP